MQSRISILLYSLNFFFFFFFSSLLLSLSLSLSNAAVNSTSATSDAVGLLAFKAKADVRHNLLPFYPNATSRFCRWPGIQCYANTSRVVRLVIRGLDLGGVFAPGSLSGLDQLRVLTLQNTSLHGPIPDLSPLVNLKNLFLDHNSFAGAFPPSILFLHRIRTIDFSHNNLTGPLPASLTGLDRLNSLRLDHNHLNGTIPPLNQSSLTAFNVSGNLLYGAVPVTTTLLRFDQSSFSDNPGLCGEIVGRECSPGPPFFTPTASPLQAQVNNHNSSVDVAGYQRKSGNSRMRTALIVGFSCVGFVLVCSLLCFAFAAAKKRKRGKMMKNERGVVAVENADAAAARRGEEQERELEEKVKRAQLEVAVAKSGSLVFCAGEAQLYSLDQLMRASAEMLGRGIMGTTYKAVLDNRLIVCVKRLDAAKLAGTSRETFERHMDSVGGLRHPNLIPLRAYFQAKEERLLIYDYQPNGSLYSLIHGSKSTRAKALHWTSCLKIAEDVAQGLSYIHQAWRLVHGNLNSHNVLLGPDFEACIADYCLSALLSDEELSAEHHHLHHSSPYRAPEIRSCSSPWFTLTTAKSDVYSFGVLILELVSGKEPSELADPNSILSGNDIRTTNNNNNKMEMLMEVAAACTAGSAEQRPTMWQVMKMLQEIKDAVLMEDDGGGVGVGGDRKDDAPSPPAETLA